MRILAILLCFCYVNTMDAQDLKLHAKNWILGTKGKTPPSGGTMFTFDSVDTTLTQSSFISLTYSGRTLANISDSKGNLQIYSDGCVIYGKDNQALLNGDSLNYPDGPFWQPRCTRPDFRLSYGPMNGIYMLPIPDSDTRYAVFHLRIDSDTIQISSSFLYTEVDMALDGGKGAVTIKNQVIAQDTFLEVISAVQHGNGRDWWIGAPIHNSDEMCLFLLTPYGLEGPFYKKTPLVSSNSEPYYQITSAQFSPDGTKYARLNAYDWTKPSPLQLMNFDRCTGEFSCPLEFPLPFPADTVFTPGVEFSPNGQFLYGCTNTKLYQYDLKDEDPQSSRETVGIYDGFKGPALPTTFHQMQRALNGKIYMSCANGVRWMHTIHEPNKKGKACDFRQHDFQPLTTNGFNVPKFPNYNLYDWPDSPCDTLGINAPEGVESVAHKAGLYAFPSPSSTKVTINLPPCASSNPTEEKRRIRVFNIAGQFLLEEDVHFSKTQVDLDVSYWPSGVYVVYYEEGVVREATRFVVLR